MITLAQLEYIIAVDTYRHFAKAAEHCFITQPNLSMQIKKLEDYLGVIIFDRAKQPVLPTEVGVKILEQARIALQEAKKINIVIDDYKGEVSGELKIGIIPTLTPYLLPRFIGRFSEKYPQVKVSVEEHYTTELESMLKRDMIDVAIVVTPLKDDKLIEDPLFYEEMMVYANSDHPISKNRFADITDITSPGIWLLSDGHCFRHQIINLCNKHLKSGVDMPFVFDGGSLDTVMKIIDREGGFTLVPELAVMELPLKRAENVRKFFSEKPLREVSLVTARHYAKSKLISCLKSEIQSALPKFMMNGDRGSVVGWR